MGLGIVLFSRLENWLDAFALRIGAPMQGSPSLLGGRDLVLLPRLSHASVLEMHLARWHGVSAGLEYVLPGRFLWQLTTDAFEGVREQAPFEAERLRWTLLRLLREPDDMPPSLAARVSALTGASSNPEGSDLALFDLAERLARVFEGYVLNRPDWLQAWQQGASALPKGAALGLKRRERFAALEPWQAWLWQRILKDIGPLAEEHPFSRFERDLAQVVDTAREKGIGRITVMGLPGLTTQQMRLLALLGQHLDVRWLAMNPCRSFWDDLPELARHSPESFLPEEPWLNEQGPRLLGLWGKAQRDYLAQLRELETVPGLSVSLAEIDVPADTTAPGLLHDLQAAIETRAPFPASAQQAATVAAEPAQAASLQVHGGQGLTHQALLLREALVRRLEGPQADLKPSDCLILCTDLEAARPAIHQVFGAANEAGGQLPYRIAPPARPQGALATLLLDLLALRWSAFSLEQLGSWLGQPLFVQMLRLEASQASQCLSDLAKAGFITNRGERHGFDAALERLLLGAALAPPTKEVDLDAARLGMLLVERRALPLCTPQDMAQLDRLLGLLRSLQHLTRERLTMLKWVERLDAWLLDWIDPILPSAEDQGLRDEVMAVRMALNRVARMQPTVSATADKTGRVGPADASVPAVEVEAAADAVDVALFRRCLEQALSSAGGQLQFSGGINIMALGDGLLPPARLVAVLGMDLSRWPRPSLADELDLAVAWPRRGDLSQSAADRAALLDALLAARSDFWLFYEAVDPVSGETLGPASPVSELLVTADIKAQVHRVPIPFAARRAARLNPRQAHAWTLGYGREQQALRSPLVLRRRVRLRSLCDLAFDPARAILRQWSLALERNEAMPSQEPLDGNLGESGRAWQQSDLILALVRGGKTLALATDEGSVLTDHPHLADGPPGQHMTGLILEQAQALRAQLRGLLGNDTALESQRLVLSIGDIDLEGQVLMTSETAHPARHLLLSTRSVAPRDKLLLVLEHALVNAVRGGCDSHLVMPDKTRSLAAFEGPETAAAFLQQGLALLDVMTLQPDSVDTAPLLADTLKPKRGGANMPAGEGGDDEEAEGNALTDHGQLLWKEPGPRGAAPQGLHDWLGQAAALWGSNA